MIETTTRVLRAGATGLPERAVPERPAALNPGLTRHARPRGTHRPADGRRRA